VIILDRLNCLWLNNQNNYDLLCKIQQYMDSESKSKMCVLQAIDNSFSKPDFCIVDCYNCIQDWLNSKRN